MYYPSSENKGADQLRGYREADLRLCFRLCRLLVFPRGGSSDTVRILGTVKGFSASIVTTHGAIVVPRFLPRNGPSGTYSHFCISLAEMKTDKINDTVRILGTVKGFSASIVTTQGALVVPRFLPRNGPSGTYSHF